MADFLTVTLNPTVDVATWVDQLIDHEKLRCDKEVEQVGGGGVNVAQVLHWFGGQCQALLTAGGYRGQEIVHKLQEDGIDCLPVPITQTSRQCFTVYEKKAQHEYRFILPGPSLSDTEIDSVIAFILQHLPNKWLVLSGSLPVGVPDDFYARVIKRARDLAPEIKFLVDAPGPILKHAIAAGVNLIKPSLKEFEWLTGQTLKNQSQRVGAAREYVTHGQIECVALSLGAEGAIAVTKQEALAAAALPVAVTSTVGAGDSFAAALLWALSNNNNLHQALSIATATAATALQTQGKLQFDAAAIKALSQEVVVTSVD